MFDCLVSVVCIAPIPLLVLGYYCLPLWRWTRDGLAWHVYVCMDGCICCFVVCLFALPSALSLNILDLHTYVYVAGAVWVAYAVSVVLLLHGRMSLSISLLSLSTYLVRTSSLSRGPWLSAFGVLWFLCVGFTLSLIIFGFWSLIFFDAHKSPSSYGTHFARCVGARNFQLHCCCGPVVLGFV